MINLIPPTSKKKLRTEYLVRVVSVWFLLLMAVFFIGASMLLPVYVLIGSQVAAYESSSVVALEKVAGYENVSVKLTQSSNQAKVVLNTIESPLFSDFIDLFDGLRGADVQLNTFGISRSDNGINPISLSGVAGSRQSLASFRDRLLAERSVESVDFPISNLAKDKDLTFSITVTLNNSSDI